VSRTQTRIVIVSLRRLRNGDLTRFLRLIWEMAYIRARIKRKYNHLRIGNRTPLRPRCGGQWHYSRKCDFSQGHRGQAFISFITIKEKLIKY
jgi:hypothetical protein